jgi:hypothetical protein
MSIPGIAPIISSDMVAAIGSGDSGLDGNSATGAPGGLGGREQHGFEGG